MKKTMITTLLTVGLLSLTMNSSELLVENRDTDPFQITTTEQPKTYSIQDTLNTVTSTLKELPQQIQNTDSIVIRLIFVFLLGILMSLTPCIYPMIPITLGVLHGRQQQSIFKNFLLSLSYTIGLATTFALFGLLAASSGQAFGHLMGNTFFVLGLVAILGYFAFSMFGFYNLAIPRFLQKKQSLSEGGSFLPVFLFGVASGTVASPCLSPGLAFVLTLVAALANKFLGFLLLFAFGVGVSFPLLIIGTFSHSLNILPRAGMWMIEVQKIFGFLLLGMCIYYLSNIIPTFFSLALTTLLLITIHGYYLYAAYKAHTKLDRYVKTLCSITAGALAIFMATQTTLEYFVSKNHNPQWYSNYQEARNNAQQDNKKLVMDFWAPYCSICKEITKKVLHNPKVEKVLEKFTVVTLNISEMDANLYSELQQRYNIQGVPDIMVIDPVSGDIIKRWKSEIYNKPTDEFIQELEEIA